MAIKIALAGNPNCGKTTLFNSLTGSNQYVGNWPGVTVEKKEGKLKGHDDVVIQDLPGIYSLSPYTLEEVVARNYLIGERPDAILNIIDGTNLDFPVMYAPDNKDFYLRHDFNKAYSVYGVPYLDEQTTLGANAESDNLIIYGHNMKTGTIFGCLTEYRKADYYQEHPFIEFDTVYGDAKYEVFGAFTIDVVNDTSFIYNQYIDMDEDTYNRYVDQVISRSDVDSGIRPAYGEQLLTLSTCEYSSANGRYVVVARRVRD